LPHKLSLAPVSVLESLPVAEIVNALHLRDFWRQAIFDFFNTIGGKADNAPSLL